MDGLHRARRVWRRICAAGLHGYASLARGEEVVDERGIDGVFFSLVIAYVVMWSANGAIEAHGWVVSLHIRRSGQWPFWRVLSYTYLRSIFSFS